MVYLAIKVTHTTNQGYTHMVKKSKKDRLPKQENQVNKALPAEPIKISSSTPYEYCNERLSSFGGYLALIKFFDMIGFKEIFHSYWNDPKRRTQLGSYRMIVGFLSLLFIGFHRIGHFTYIRFDPMLCGYLQVNALPFVSTFWRFVKSLGINQSRNLLNMSAVLRDRVWQATGLCLETVRVNFDTTVSTVYGNIEGGRKGHNTKHRGKKALRPALLFIAETREYLVGKQRRGETMSGEEVRDLIIESRKYLPKSVRHVLLRGDGEFISPESIQACHTVGYQYIFKAKAHRPLFPEKGWYRYGGVEYNEVIYQPKGWKQAERFLVMRVLKDKAPVEQLEVFTEDQSVQRMFVTNRKGRVHQLIAEYDAGADVENCIGEAQRAGILAIPSKSFACHAFFFQLVMFAYNLWRWMSMVAEHAKASKVSNQERKKEEEKKEKDNQEIKKEELTSNTLPILRLKMLFISTKIVKHSHYTKARYSIHDARASGLMEFMKHLDKRRKEKIKWRDDVEVTRYRKCG